MKKSDYNINEIAKRSNRSKSTVSKVVNHCHGVSPQVRQEILNIIRELDMQTSQNHEPNIHIIIPDNPKFFWNPVYQKISMFQDTLAIKISIYPNIASSADIAATYIDFAEEHHVKVVIIAAVPDDNLKIRLRKLAEKALVIQLCEYSDVPNTFYVGSDPFEDGKQLASALREPPEKIVIIESGKSLIQRERIRGFKSGLPEGHKIISVACPIEVIHSAQIARLLKPHQTDLQLIFCPDGMTPYVCEAIHKLKLTPPPQFIGFEMSPKAKTFFEDKKISFLMVQQPEKHMEQALTLAKNFVTEHVYPDRKFNYLPSLLLNEKSEP